MKVAIIGAGITGSLTASKLRNQGHQVSVFDKASGPGGRCTQKRSDWGRFDMGATVLPVSDDDFNAFMQQLETDGLASQWPQNIYEYDGELVLRQNARSSFVFVPGMDHVCKHWLDGSNLQTDYRVTCILQTADGLRLRNEQGEYSDSFERVICTLPWPQAKGLLQPFSSELILSKQQRWTSCWSLAFQFEQRIDIPAELIYIKNALIQSIVLDTAKPGRRTGSFASDSQIWVVQLSNDASDILGMRPDNLQDTVLRALSEIFFSYTAAPLPQLTHCYQHYWRYARPASGELPLGIISLNNGTLLAGGDWSMGASVQSACQVAEQLSVYDF